MSEEKKNIIYLVLLALVLAYVSVLRGGEM